MRFTTHMAWHMALVTLVAPLLVLAIRGGRFTGSAASVPPLIACLIEFIVVWGWHLPVLQNAARENVAMFAAEQASFFIAAILLWLSILGGSASDRRDRAAVGVVALVLTFAHMTMLGALIALAPRVLYGHHTMTIADQQLGGALMIVAGAVVYPLAALWIVGSLVLPGRAGARS
jgi:putative membrane protein